MGRVKIPYYVAKNGHGYWQPTRFMREAGFEPVACGPDGPDAWRKAADCLARWKEYVAAKQRSITPLMPAGSLAEAFQRYRGTAEWSAKAPRTREEWERAWFHIGRVFGDVRPHTVMLEHISGFRGMVEGKFQGGRRTGLSRFGARFGVSLPQWDIASGMLTHR
jgi:hypothetical protein